MLGKLLRGQEGQSLPILILSLTVVVGSMALAIDAGAWYAQSRAMQGAADGGSLAAAHQLCLSLANPEAMAIHYAERNGAEDVAVTVDTDAKVVTVTAQANFPGIFSPVIGISDLEVSAEAAAQAICGESYVIWAHSNSCDDAIDWSGSELDVQGHVHSNNDVKMGGSDNTVSGRFEYVSSFDMGGSGNDVDLKKVPYEPNRPVDFNINDFKPGGSAAAAAAAQGKYHSYGGDFEVSDQGTVLDGLYYVNGDVKLSGSDLSGNVTIVATGWIEVSGSNDYFTPYWAGLLFFSNKRYSNADDRCSKEVMLMSGSDNTFEGIVYAPRGKIDFPGSGITNLLGALVGDTIKLSGSKEMAEEHMPSGQTRVHLIH